MSLETVLGRREASGIMWCSLTASRDLTSEKNLADSIDHGSSAATPSSNLPKSSFREARQQMTAGKSLELEK